MKYEEEKGKQLGQKEQQNQPGRTESGHQYHPGKFGKQGIDKDRKEGLDKEREEGLNKEKTEGERKTGPSKF